MIVLADSEYCQKVRHPDDVLNLAQEADTVQPFASKQHESLSPGQQMIENILDITLDMFLSGEKQDCTTSSTSVLSRTPDF